jgi:VanZ family protein
MTPRKSGNQAVPSGQFTELFGKVSAISRISGWLLATAIVVLSLVPPALRPETGLPHNLEHFGIFWAVGTAFALGYRPGYIRLLAWLVIFAGGVEVAQLFAPGRHARLTDFIVDALAACAGAFSVWLARSIYAPLARAKQRASS